MIKIWMVFVFTSFFNLVPPAAVKKAFEAKFPEATQVKWSKENAHEYEAEFKWNKKSYSANFNDKGIWLETESSTNFISLPIPVQKAIDASNLNKATIKALNQIEKANGKMSYEVEIKKGGKLVELFYAENGQLIKK